MLVIALAYLCGWTGSVTAQAQPAASTAPELTAVAALNVPLGGRSLTSLVSEPGVYVQLYRPHGAIDFSAPLPYHVTVYNLSGADFDPWQLSFAYDGAIDLAWNASVTRDGERFVVTPEPWNGVLRHGEVRQFGFVGRSNNRARPDPDAASYLLHGAAVDPQPADFAAGHEECRLEVDFVVQAEGQWWSSEPRSYFGEFYLRNVGDEPAEWALQWSLDRRGASGPGTRAMANAVRLVGGEYYLRSTEAEGPIEPGGTRSFAMWGSYSAQPYDLVPCPQEVQVAPDPAALRYQELYEALSAEEKRAVECGNLVWNGWSFSIPSQLSGRRRSLCE